MLTVGRGRPALPSPLICAELMRCVPKGGGEASVIILFNAKKKAFSSFAPFRNRASSKREVGGLKKEILASGFSRGEFDLRRVGWLCGRKQTRASGCSWPCVLLVSCCFRAKSRKQVLFVHSTVSTFPLVFAQMRTVTKHCASHISTAVYLFIH